MSNGTFLYIFNKFVEYLKQNIPWEKVTEMLPGNLFKNLNKGVMPRFTCPVMMCLLCLLSLVQPPEVVAS